MQKYFRGRHRIDHDTLVVSLQETDSSAVAARVDVTSLLSKSGVSGSASRSLASSRGSSSPWRSRGSAFLRTVGYRSSRRGRRVVQVQRNPLMLIFSSFGGSSRATNRQRSRLQALRRNCIARRIVLPAPGGPTRCTAVPGRSRRAASCPRPGMPVRIWPRRSADHLGRSRQLRPSAEAELREGPFSDPPRRTRARASSPSDQFPALEAEHRSDNDTSMSRIGTCRRWASSI